MDKDIRLSDLIANNIKRIMKEKDYSDLEVYLLFRYTFKFEPHDIARILYPSKDEWAIITYNQLKVIAQWLSVDVSELMQ